MRGKHVVSEHRDGERSPLCFAMLNGVRISGSTTRVGVQVFTFNLLERQIEHLAPPRLKNTPKLTKRHPEHIQDYHAPTYT